MIKKFTDEMSKIVGTIALLYLMGMSFGYGFTRMVEAKTYIIEVHDTTEPDEVK